MLPLRVSYMGWLAAFVCLSFEIMNSFPSSRKNARALDVEVHNHENHLLRIRVSVEVCLALLFPQISQFATPASTPSRLWGSRLHPWSCIYLCILGILATDQLADVRLYKGHVGLFLHGLPFSSGMTSGVRPPDGDCANSAHGMQ